MSERTLEMVRRRIGGDGTEREMRKLKCFHLVLQQEESSLLFLCAPPPHAVRGSVPSVVFV